MRRTTLIVFMIQLKNTFGSTYLTIEYDAQNQWIFYRWRGFIRAHEIKEGFSKILDVVAETKCSSILGDHSSIVGPWNECNDWLIKEWTPHAVKVGFKYWAIYTGDDLFSNISLELFLLGDRSKIYYWVHVFDGITLAREWLKMMVQKKPALPDVEKLP